MGRGEDVHCPLLELFPQQIAMVGLSSQREEKGFIMKMLTRSYLQQYELGCYDLIYCRNRMPVLAEGRSGILQSSGVLGLYLEKFAVKKKMYNCREIGNQGCTNCSLFFR